MILVHSYSLHMGYSFFFFLNDPAPPEIYLLPLPDPFPIYARFNRHAEQHLVPLRAGRVNESLRLIGSKDISVESAPLLVDGLPEFLDVLAWVEGQPAMPLRDRKSTRLNSSHGYISYAVFCL